MQKITCFLYLMFFACFAQAQSQEGTHLQVYQLGERGLLLNKGWVYRTGDNITYADSAMSTKNWKSVDPTVNIPDLPKELRSGICWLRLKFSVPKHLQRTAGITLRSAGAIEVYLNGKLIGKRGLIDPVTKDGNNYLDRVNPIELPLIGSGVQVLAIRYANQQSMAWVGGYTLPPFLFARLTNTPQLIRNMSYFQNTDAGASVAIGILTLLALLHLIFLKYNPGQRANLYFACYALLFALFLVGTIISTHAQFMDRQVFTLFLNIFFYIVSVLFAIKALYTLFNFKTYWHLFVLTPLCLFLGLLGAFDEHTDAIPITLVALLLTCVQLALTVSAVYHKRRGALIVATGFLVGLIGVFCYVYIIYTFKSTPELSFIVSTSLAMLGPPLGISFFLGREFALDSQMLQYKLIEVEQLSIRSLKQEQEKQELLASQNEILEQQVQERTHQLSQSLTHLQQTQDQLIQAEKMASLGELTAGIAHEIQNPLNFVNNFAEVSQELIEEMETELKNGDATEAMAIAADIRQNLEKIHHHGQRADFIVKGMLQHTQSSTTKHQPEDINLLVEEYSELAYNGFRVKNNTFLATINKELAVPLPLIPISAQEIGRVLLNIFNNAFYALYEKQKNTDGFIAVLSIHTAIQQTSVEIRISDNGTGIPTAQLDKIMQPFFTTKPTGEGTGLGLSLSYDIVVKGHGGQINVESMPNQGATFVISLPLQSV